MRLMFSGGHPRIWAPAVTEKEGSAVRGEVALERRAGDEWVRIQVFGSPDDALSALDDAVGRGEGTADHYRIVELGRSRVKVAIGVAAVVLLVGLVVFSWIWLATR